MDHDKQSKGGIIEKLFPGNNQICVAFVKGLPVIQLSFVLYLQVGIFLCSWSLPNYI